MANRIKNKVYKKYPFLSHERVYKTHGNKPCQLLRNAEIRHYQHIKYKYRYNLKKS